MKVSTVVRSSAFAWLHLVVWVSASERETANMPNSALATTTKKFARSPSRTVAKLVTGWYQPEDDLKILSAGHWGRGGTQASNVEGQIRQLKGVNGRNGMGKGGGKGRKKGKNKAKGGMQKGKGGRKKKGKSGSRGKGMKNAKEKRGNDQASICYKLELGVPGSGGQPVSIFNRGKAGKGKGRQRGLQGCSFDAFELIKQNPDMMIFFELLKATGLEGALGCSGPFTVLAPSNTAFQKNPELLKSLFNPRNAGLVRDMLLYHFVPEYLLAKDFSAGPLSSLLGPTIDVKRNPLMFNQAGVSDPDLVACNAAVHLISNPLIPQDSPILPEICRILDFRRPGQFPLPGQYNSIFDRRNLLSIQVENRKGGRRLQFTGERCDNDVLDAIRQDPDLSTFESLLKDTGVEEIFLCAGPFTVLAPTNMAFAEMNPALLERLRRPENVMLLREVLLYHMLPEYQLSRSFDVGPTETLLFGNDVDVAIDPLSFNTAQIVIPDTIACNGVVHSIDDVLTISDQPERCEALTFTNRRRLQDRDCDTNILDTARDISELSTVVSLIDAAELEYIFDCPGPFTALLPNNDAFDKLSDAGKAYLTDPANLDELKNILLYHILPNRTMAKEFEPGTVTTLSEDEVQVRLFPLRFDDSRVVTQDIDGCNGLINIIDTVLSPFEFPTQPPVPAPTPAPTPMDVCASGDYTFKRRNRVLQSGGQGCTSNVFDTAQENADLQVVTELIAYAGLEPIFACAGPFTALLPTNAVFEALNADQPDFLQSLADDREALRNFLLNHLLPGAQQLNQFSPGPVDTLLGGSQVDVTTAPLQFNGNGVVTGDIQACNGYIHILGGILDPNAPGPTPPPTTATPTLSPMSAPPTATPVQRVRIADFYISYANAQATRAPTEEEYNEMMSRTNQWFSDAFEEFYKDSTETNFIRAETAIDLTLYGADAGIPEERFNIYIDFSFTDIIYTEDSVLPPTKETFDLLEDQITADYILQQVRTYTGTPFEQVNEVWFAASEKDAP